MNRWFFISILIVGAYCNDQTTISSQITTTRVNNLNQHENITAANICDVCQCTVNIINCTNRQLTHHFENGSWPNSTITLKIVNFEENFISHLKPFGNYTINKLILRFNKIVRIDDRTFKEIRDLTELDLSHNYLTSDMLRPSIFEGKFNPNQWEPLPNLHVLDLGHNNLHTLNSDVFAHIPEIEVLILSGNPLDVIDHSSIIALSNLYHLKELRLEYCNLKMLPDYLFHVHKANLKKLYLNGNLFSSIPNTLMDTAALEYLNLDKNLFEVLDHVNAFPKLTMLKKLSLYAMPHLTKIGSGAFSNLTALEELILTDCPHLQTIDDNAMSYNDIHGRIWPPLKKLDISNNKLKYLPGNLVGKWDKLEELGISGNEWSCDCENQYFVETLLPILKATLLGGNVNEILCYGPPEHAGKIMSSLSHRKLRCLDLYGARPERDAAILVGSFIAILLFIPIIIALFFLWRRGFFFCDKNPATFSRAFYQRTSNDDYI